ncbi:MAG: ABC transporter permease [Planctomycetota bacterium]|jgi:putative ABC transport system permease protein
MQQIKIVRNILSGIENLLLHKLRSLLTMLGIVFGVGSVVAMLAVGEGASAHALAQIRKLGSDNINPQVRPIPI